MAIQSVVESFRLRTDGKEGYEFLKTYDYLSGVTTYTATSTIYYDLDMNWVGESFDDGNGTTSHKKITFNDDGSYVEEGGWTITLGTTSLSETYSYQYDANDAFLGGTTVSDTGLTTVYDRLWNVVSTSQDITDFSKLNADSGVAYELYGSAYFTSETVSSRWGETEYTTYFNATGQLIGTSDSLSSSYTDWNGDTVTTVTTSYFDADQNWFGSDWSDSEGNEGWDRHTTELDTGDRDGDGSTNDLVFVQRGSSTWTWSGDSETETYEYFYEYDPETQSSTNFLGGSTTNSQGVTTKYDENWNVISTAKDVRDLNLDQLTSDDGMAYELFGAAYVDVQTYTDRWGTSTEYTYYDKDGVQLGTGNGWENTWYDDYQEKDVTSINISFSDANWNWLGSEWSDTNGNSGWNSTGVEIDVNDVDGDGDTTDKVFVEKGFNEWSWDDGNGGQDSDSNSYVYYYTYNESDPYSYNREFLGGSNTNGSGETTEYDANWNVVGSSRSVEGMEQLSVPSDGDTSDLAKAYELYALGQNADGSDLAVYYAIDGNSWDNEWGSGSWEETSFYDADGNKLGSMNTSTNTWYDEWQKKDITSTNVSYQDANWHQLYSKWGDDNGNEGSYAKTLVVDTEDRDGDGDRSDLVHKEESSNTWSWTDRDGEVHTDGSSSVYYYSYDANDEYGYYSEFLGGTSTNNSGETTEYDKDWKVIASKRDVSSLDPLTAEVDATAYELYAKGMADDGSDLVVKYSSESDSWSDTWGSGSWTNTSYYDVEGNKLGMVYESSNTWYDQWQEKNVTSTNINYQDENGHTLKSEWSDSNGNKGSSQTTLVADVDDRDGDGDTSELIREEKQSSEWSWDDGQGNTFSDSNSSVYYYSYDSEDQYGYYQEFLGGINTSGSGETTTYDKNWNVVSRTRDVSDLDKLVSSNATDLLDQAYSLFSEGKGASGDADIYYVKSSESSWDSGSWYEYTFYSDAGLKVGSVNGSTSTWTDWNDQSPVTSTNLNFQDASGQSLRSAWSDTKGNSNWSETTLITDTDDIDGDGDQTDLIYQENGGNTWSWDDGTTVQTQSNSHTYYYSYDPDDIYGYYKEFLGGKEFDSNGELTAEYGKNWSIVRDVSDLTEFVVDTNDAISVKAEFFFDPAYVDVYENTWSDSYGSGSNKSITYYDSDGATVGSYYYSANSSDSNNYMNESFQNASGNTLESQWSDDNGWNKSLLVEDTNDRDGDGDKTDTIRLESNQWSWSWDDNGTTITETNSQDYYYTYSEDDPSGYYKAFLGGTETRSDGETITYDENWNEISRTRDISGLTRLSKTNDADEVAYALYGPAYFSEESSSSSYESSTWSSTNVQYYNSDGVKIGSAYLSESSWTDTNSGETSTNTNANYQDEDGNQLRNEWSNATNGVVTNSGWNVNRIEFDTKDWDGDGLTTDKVRVEEGENSWYDDYRGENRTNSYTRYYAYKADDQYGYYNTFLGAVEENDTGEVTTFDKDWNVISRTQNIDAIKDNVVTASSDEMGFALYAQGQAADGGDAVIYYSENSDTWSDETTGNSSSWTNRTYYNADGEQVGSSNWNSSSYDGNTSDSQNYHDAEGNNISSSWKDSSGNQNWSKNSLVVDESDRDGDGDTTDLIRLEESSNTWTNWQGELETHTQTYYYTYDPEDEYGYYKEFLGGVEKNSSGQITEYDQDWTVLSQKVDLEGENVKQLSADAAEGSIERLEYEYFGTASFTEESGGWTSDDGTGSYNTWTNRTYYDANGVQIGSANFSENAWFDDYIGELSVSSNVNIQDENWNTLYSSWENGEGSGNIIRNTLVVDELDRDQDGDTTDYIRLESGEDKWAWINESGQTEYNGRTWEYYYSYEEGGEYWQGEFLGGTETTEWDGTVNYDSDWNRVAGDGYAAAVEVDGWNEGARFTVTIDDLPSGLGQWWESSMTMSRYSTSVIELSTGEHSVLRVVDNLTGEILDGRELADNEKLITTQRSADGTFFIATVNDAGTVATLNKYSFAFGSVDLNTPIGDSFVIELPAGLRNASWDPWVYMSEPNMDGIGFFYTRYTTEKFLSTGTEWIDHQELYSFDSTGKTKLITIPEHDWLNITPSLDGSDPSVYVQMGTSNGEEFYRYEYGATNPWITIDRNEHWDNVDAYRGQQTLVRRDDAIIFDLQDYAVSEDGAVADRVRDVTEISDGTYLIKTQYQYPDSYNYQHWYVVDQSGIVTDYAFNTSIDRSIRDTARWDWAYSPDEADSEKVYFVAHDYDSDNLRFDDNGLLIRTIEGWNEGSYYSVDVPGLPVGEGNWWVEDRVESRYSTVTAEFSNGERSILKVVNILTGEVLASRDLADTENFLYSQKNGDGHFYVSSFNEADMQVTVNTYSMALEGLSIEVPVADAVTFNLPDDFVPPKNEPVIHYSPAQADGVGFIYFEYSSEEGYLRDLYKFDSSGVMTLVDMPEGIDRVYITPTPDSSDSDVLLDVRLSDGGREYLLLDSATLETQEVSEDDHWSLVDEYRNHKSIVQVNGEILFDLNDLENVPDGYTPRIGDVVDMGDGNTLVRIEHSGPENGFERWLVVSSSGVVADYSFENDRNIRTTERDDWTYSPDDFDQGYLYFAAHGVDVTKLPADVSSDAIDGFAVMRIAYADLTSTLKNLSEVGDLLRSDKVETVVTLNESDLLPLDADSSVDWIAYPSGSIVEASISDPSDGGLILHIGQFNNDTKQRVANFVVRVESDGSVSKVTEMDVRPQDMFVDETAGYMAVSSWNGALSKDQAYVVKISDGSVLDIPQGEFEAYRSNGGVFPVDWDFDTYSGWTNVDNTRGFTFFGIDKADVQSTVAALEKPGDLLLSENIDIVLHVRDSEVLANVDQTFDWSTWPDYALIPANVADVNDDGFIVHYSIRNNETGYESSFVARIESDGSISKATEIGNNPEEMFIDESLGLAGVSYYSEEQNDDQAYVVRLSDGEVMYISQDSFEAVRDADGFFPNEFVFDVAQSEYIQAIKETVLAESLELSNTMQFADKLFGSDESESIGDYLNSADQLLSGLGGDDTIISGLGIDLMQGGEGADRFIISTFDQQSEINDIPVDFITDFGEGDAIELPSDYVFDAALKNGSSSTLADNSYVVFSNYIDGRSVIIYDANSADGFIAGAGIGLKGVVEDEYAYDANIITYGVI